MNPLGIAIGIGLGTAMGNPALGIALGFSLGLLFEDKNKDGKCDKCGKTKSLCSCL